MLRHSNEYTNMEYRGVKRDEKRKKWLSSITVNRIFHFLGEFDEAEEAAIAYDQKAVELLGKYATLNHPELVGGTNGIMASSMEGRCSTDLVKGVLDRTRESTDPG